MSIDIKFEQIINIILTNEGGYSNNSSDKGGETKYGISKRSYPDLDVKDLTPEQAKAIYFRDFWNTQPYKNIDDIRIATKVFDLSINMGATAANKLLQRALRATGNCVVEDGIIGGQTIAAINSTLATELLSALKSEAAGYYRIIAATKPEQKVFLSGWLNRAYA